MNSNQAYHAYTKRSTVAAAGIDKAEGDVARLEAKAKQLEAQLAAAKERLTNHRQSNFPRCLRSTVVGVKQTKRDRQGWRAPLFTHSGGGAAPPSS